MPYEKDIEFLTNLKVEDISKNMDQLLSLDSTSYDLVFNGVEVGSGALRVYIPQLQKKILQLLGMPDERIEANFGWMMKAYSFGAPPHRGWGLGIDRILMLAEQKESIRDVIAFPRNKYGYDPLTDSPNSVDKKQLDEINIQVKEDKKQKE
jgi:aspartyl-tRNA synthetase